MLFFDGGSGSAIAGTEDEALPRVRQQFLKMLEVIEETDRLYNLARKLVQDGQFVKNPF